MYIKNKDKKALQGEKIETPKYINENKVPIDSCTLDSIAEKLDHISLIKIDTEGAELFTIKSGKNIFKKTMYFMDRVELP